MATNNPSEVGGNDPSVQRQIERQNAALQQSRTGLSSPPSVSGTTGPNVTTTAGAVRNLAPIVSGSETLFPQSTTATSNNAVTINSSINNDTGDVTTVYSTNGRITVNPINQTINQYTSVDSGVSQIVAGTGVTITSTGNSGTGVVTVSSSTAFGNIVNVNLNGNVNSVLRGDGTWGADANSSYGNSNVVSLLASFGSNTITTTGNVSVGNISATNLGNIVGTNYDGNAANVLHGDGTWSADVTDYGNSNVANYLPTYTGNLSGDYLVLTHDANANVVFANYLYGDGSNITNLPVGNIASVNLDGNASNVLRGDGTFGPDANSSYGDSNVTSLLGAFGSNTIVTTGIITADGANLSNVPYGNLTGAPSLGNISSINLDGSSSNILYGNGVFAAAPSGGGLPLANGNSNFDIAALDGNATITANSTSTWTFGTDGLLTLPSGNVVIGSVFGADAILASNTPIGVVSQGNGSTVVQWIDDISNASALSAIYINSPSGGPGDVVVLTGAVGANANIWNFTANGNLVLPNGNSVIYSIANSSLDPTLPNVSTMTLTPDANYNSQVLVLDPTAPGHIHLRAYAFSNIDDPAANIFLGGEATSFEITQGANNQAVIHSNGKAWTFGNDGNITSDTLTFTTSFANVKTVEYQTAGVWDLYVEDSVTGSNTAISRLNVSFKDNLIDKPQVYIENTKESDGIALRWTFDENGNLNFPRDVAGNTDPYLSIFGGSTPTIQSTDVSLAGPANLAISADYLNLSGFSGDKIVFYADTGEMATDANMTLTTNLANTGNTSSWVFGTDGSLTLPGNLLAVSASPAPVISGFSSVSALQFTNGNSNVTINANSNTWTFDSTGNLTIPGSSGGFIKTVANSSIGIAAIDNGTDNPAQLLSINANGTPTTAVSSYANEATIQANINGSIQTWAFTNAGVVTSPVLTYANLSAATTAGRRAFISDANLAAAGNFGNAVSGGGANTVPVYSDGSVWRIG